VHQSYINRPCILPKAHEKCYGHGSIRPTFGGIGGLYMAHAKQASKRKRRRTALPALGVAGVSLSLAGGASAATSGPAMDIPSRDTTASHEIALGDEEISDVSLATFYVFDKENAGASQLGQGLKLAAGGCRGGGGCRGCGGGRGCAGGCRGCGCARGCGGCGGWWWGGCSWGGCSCCASWGSCRWC